MQLQERKTVTTAHILNINCFVPFHFRMSLRSVVFTAALCLALVVADVTRATLEKAADSTSSVGIYGREHLFIKPWFQTWTLIVAQSCVSVIAVVVHFTSAQTSASSTFNSVGAINVGEGCGQWFGRTSNVAVTVPLAIVTVISFYFEALAFNAAPTSLVMSFRPLVVLAAAFYSRFLQSPRARCGVSIGYHPVSVSTRYLVVNAIAALFFIIAAYVQFRTVDLPTQFVDCPLSRKSKAANVAASLAVVVIARGGQVVLEEGVRRGRRVGVAASVGSVGMWGSLVAFLGMLIAWFVNVDPSPLAFANAGRSEAFPDAFTMLGNSAKLRESVAGASIAAVVTAMIASVTTGRLSGVRRAGVDTLAVPLALLAEAIAKPAYAPSVTGIVAMQVIGSMLVIANVGYDIVRAPTDDDYPGESHHKLDGTVIRNRQSLAVGRDSSASVAEGGAMSMQPRGATSYGTLQEPAQVATGTDISGGEGEDVAHIDISGGLMSVERYERRKRNESRATGVLVISMVFAVIVMTTVLSTVMVPAIEIPIRPTDSWEYQLVATPSMFEGTPTDRVGAIAKLVDWFNKNGDTKAGSLRVSDGTRTWYRRDGHYAVEQGTQLQLTGNSLKHRSVVHGASQIVIKQRFPNATAPPFQVAPSYNNTNGYSTWQKNETDVHCSQPKNPTSTSDFTVFGRDAYSTYISGISDRENLIDNFDGLSAYFPSVLNHWCPDLGLNSTTVYEWKVQLNATVTTKASKGDEKGAFVQITVSQFYPTLEDTQANTNAIPGAEIDLRVFRRNTPDLESTQAVVKEVWLRLAQTKWGWCGKYDTSTENT